jgi:hypothetical protein
VVQLAAIVQPTALTTSTDAELYLVPALIADAGDARLALISDLLT